MSNVGESDVAIFPTFKGFRSTVESEVDSVAATSGNKFSSTFGKAVKGIGAGIAVGLGAAIAGAAAIASKGLDRALNIQDAKAQLTGLGHSAEAVATIMGSALDSVKGTAFGLDSAATIAASAVAAGIKPGEALTRTLKLTADAATIGKASLSEMGDMVNKVATNGKLTTQVLQQFQGRGIPLLQLVADQYGVTAEAAAEMVTKGEVDFANFQIALEKGVGGAALSSGATARGAFANIGASFGRLGAMFTGSAVDGAPALFVAISSAVDRLAESLKPLAEQFSGEVTPAFARVTEWINGIDFAQVGATISTVFATIKGAIKGVVEAFQTGDFSELGSTFGKIGSVVQPLFPLFVSLAEGVGGIAGSIGEVLAAGFPLLVPILEGFATALKFLGDNPGILAAALIALAAAFAVQRTAATAALALVPLQIAADIARTAALVANTNAARANSTATLSNAAATRTGFLTRLPATASILAAVPAFIAATAAAVGHRIATVAGTVASGAATAAQWAMNAALSANPIG
ncbi:MAG: tape measure protein, partial [Rhodoglobus sp.]